MKTIHEQITLSNGTTCDKGIVRLIEYLNANGYETIFSCEGGNEPAYVMFERSKNLDYIFKLTRNFTGKPRSVPRTRRGSLPRGGTPSPRHAR